MVRKPEQERNLYTDARQFSLRHQLSWLSAQSSACTTGSMREHTNLLTMLHRRTHHPDQPESFRYVAKVYVNDNQQVKAGDLLVELDARDYQARLQQAKAALDAGLAKQNEARTNVSLTRATGAASIQQATATVRQARSGVESSRAGAASSRSKASQQHRQFQLRKRTLSRPRASAGCGS